jgi:hypothetical protein
MTFRDKVLTFVRLLLKREIKDVIKRMFVRATNMSCTVSADRTFMWQKSVP